MYVACDPTNRHVMQPVLTLGVHRLWRGFVPRFKAVSEDSGDDDKVPAVSRGR